jgi:hypothetical protein
VLLARNRSSFGRQNIIDDRQVTVTLRQPSLAHPGSHDSLGIGGYSCCRISPSPLRRADDGNVGME